MNFSKIKSGRFFAARPFRVTSALFLLLSLFCLWNICWSAGVYQAPATTDEVEKFTNIHETELFAARNPAQEPAVRFAVIGDSGAGTQEQNLLARQMYLQYEKKPFSTVLMLGDNIYPDGNVKLYGQERFLKPYAPLLSQKIPFYAALGNHDIVGGFKADSMAFFKMPGEYYSFRIGNVDFFTLNTNEFNERQRLWLDNSLKASRAKWKIVYGHHPVYSSGLHRSNGHLIKTLKPILEKYRVNLYLAGHDHDYERFRPVNGVNYIISGGGGAYIRKFFKIESGSVIRLSRNHFMLFTAQGNHIAFQAIDAQAKVLDAGYLPAIVRK